MKRLLFLSILVLAVCFSAPAAYAGCSSHTYFLNGQVIICSTCCVGGYCTTTCY